MVKQIQRVGHGRSAAARACALLTILALAIAAAVTPARVQAQEPIAIAVLDTRTTSSGETAACAAVRAAITGLGLTSRTIKGDELAAYVRGAAFKPRLLALVHPETMTRADFAAVRAYIRNGGDLLMIGQAPAQSIIELTEKGLEPRREWLLRQPAQGVVFDWAQQNLGAWGKENGAGQPANAFSVKPAVPPSTEATLNFTRNPVMFQDLLVSPALTQPFPGGANLMRFRARGTGPVKELYLDWEDDQGKRWTAIVPVGAEWRDYALEPHDFREYMKIEWPEPTQYFDPAKARRLRIGIAQYAVAGSTETQTLEIGAIRYGTIAAERLTPAPLRAYADPLGPASSYLHFERGDAAQCAALLPGSPAVDPAALPRTLYTPVRFSRGVGISDAGTTRPKAGQAMGAELGRWVPWIELRDQGRTQGVISSTRIDHTLGLGHPAWSFIGCDPLAVPPAQLRALMQPVLQYENTGVMLRRGGVENVGMEPGEPLKYGIDIATRDGVNRNVRLTARLRRLDGAPGEIVATSRTLALTSRNLLNFRDVLQSDPLAEGDYVLRLEVATAAGVTFDTIEHRFSIARPRPATPEEQVVVSDGGFRLAGQPYQPQGVNYWLSLVAGQNNAMAWLMWLDPNLYDAELVEQDLAQMVEAGFTAVLIPSYSARDGRSLRDFLERCRRHNLKAQIYLSTTHPLRYDLAATEQLIKEGALDRQSALFAFDLAWEPHIGFQADRVALNPQWTRWVIEQYGSVAAATQAWNYTPASDGANIQGPTDDQVQTPGPSSVMMAAYRRFLDDEISRGYGAVARYLRGRCPGTLMAVRTGWGGTAAAFGPITGFPYDLVSGASHLDFISPEAYGLHTDWEKFKDGLIITSLARQAGHGRPVVWMEWGQTTLQVGRSDWSQETMRLPFQTYYYDLMFRMLRESQSNGSFSWWWPGGFRVAEMSDLGIIEPYGQPRPALTLYADKIDYLMFDLPPRQPDRWITIDRDLHPGGNAYIVERARSEYVQLYNQGHVVGLRTEGDGKSTEDAVLRGVGNVAWQGKGPLKYINAEITRVEYLGNDGQWRPIPAGGQINTSEMSPEGRLRVTGQNTDDVTWSAKAGQGKVQLNWDRTSGETKSAVLSQAIAQDVPWGATATIEFTLGARMPAGSHQLRFGSARTGPFGEIFNFTVEQTAGVALLNAAY